MSQSLRKPLGVEAPAPTATSKVELLKKGRRGKQQTSESQVGRVPRVARLLALAYRIDSMIRSGKLKNWAEAARLIGVTRARMTQIANLQLLAPEIQKAVLTFKLATNTDGRLTERQLRPIFTRTDWWLQESTLSTLLPDWLR